MDDKIDKITFPDLPVALDCHPDDFAKIVNIRKCGNMDVLVFDIMQDGEPLSLYFSTIDIVRLMEQL